MLTSSSNYTRSHDRCWAGPVLPASGSYDSDGAADFGTMSDRLGWPEPGLRVVHHGIIGTGSRSLALAGLRCVQDRRGSCTDWTVYNAGTGRVDRSHVDSELGTIVKQSWGGPGYSLVPGDYDGDGKTDIAVYNRRTGDWNILKSSSGYTSAMTVSLGGSGFLPVPADYDGDGKMDVAVYQPATQRWTALTSSSGYTASLQMTAGAPGDMPISTAVLPIATREHQSGDFDGEFISDITVYDTNAGVWSTCGRTRLRQVRATDDDCLGRRTGFTPVPGATTATVGRRGGLPGVHGPMCMCSSRRAASPRSTHSTAAGRATRRRCRPTATAAPTRSSTTARPAFGAG